MQSRAIGQNIRELNEILLLGFASQRLDLKTARELAMPVGSVRVSIRHGDSYIDTGGGKTISELP
ncbi:MAG TPA: hypothetical protein EYQ30_09585 [Gammaproteobacteria bacterium]|nr:hypothetical protein [Gammaproteobacteria bacterium]HIL64204.1 hypothetical protein [Porticoccaceae bacterium]HIN89912.1 hypothetical protein [Porticoccaceae bacterium]